MKHKNKKINKLSVWAGGKKQKIKTQTCAHRHAWANWSAIQYQAVTRHPALYKILVIWSYNNQMDSHKGYCEDFHLIVKKRKKRKIHIQFAQTTFYLYCYLIPFGWHGLWMHNTAAAWKASIKDGACAIDSLIKSDCDWAYEGWGWLCGLLQLNAL